MQNIKNLININNLIRANIVASDLLKKKKKNLIHNDIFHVKR